LIKYQSAYAAAAKTLSTMDALVQDILSLGGSTTAAP
jgi:flagellar hook-associated protein FlgK